MPTREMPWAEVEDVVHKASPASDVLAVAQAGPLTAARAAVVQRGGHIACRNIDVAECTLKCEPLLL